MKYIIFLALTLNMFNTNSEFLKIIDSDGNEVIINYDDIDEHFLNSHIKLTVDGVAKVNRLNSNYKSILVKVDNVWEKVRIMAPRQSEMSGDERFTIVAGDNLFYHESVILVAGEVWSDLLKKHGVKIVQE